MATRKKGEPPKVDFDPGPKRTKCKRVLDRANMIRMLSRGYTQAQVAEELKLHQTQISHDFRILMKELMAAEEEVRGEMVWKKKIEYAALKKEAWEAWEASKLAQTKEVVEKMPDRECRKCKGTGKYEPPKGRTKPIKCDVCKGTGKVPGATKITTTRQIGPGDVAYVSALLRALEAERELFGLDEPKKVEETVNANVMNWDALVTGIPRKDAPDEIEARIEAILKGQLEDRDYEEEGLPPPGTEEGITGDGAPVAPAETPDETTLSNGDD